jgi:hypothetical protein
MSVFRLGSLSLSLRRLGGARSFEFHLFSKAMALALRRLGGASPQTWWRFPPSAPQTWWRFTADLVALYRRLGGAVHYCTEHTEHYRTLFQNISQNTEQGFFKKTSKKGTLKSQRTTTFKGRSGDGRKLYG